MIFKVSHINCKSYAKNKTDRYGEGGHFISNSLISLIFYKAFFTTISIESTNVFCFFQIIATPCNSRRKFSFNGFLLWNNIIIRKFARNVFPTKWANSSILRHFSTMSKGVNIVAKLLFFGEISKKYFKAINTEYIAIAYLSELV